MPQTEQFLNKASFYALFIKRIAKIVSKNKYKKYGRKKIAMSGIRSIVSDCIKGIKKTTEAIIFMTLIPIKE